MDRYVVNYTTNSGQVDYYFCYAPSEKDAEYCCKRDNKNIKTVLGVIKAG